MRTTSVAGSDATEMGGGSDTDPFSTTSTRPGRDLEALLRPSIPGASAPLGIYSVRAGFFVAFFGGVYGTLIFSHLNSSRLGRARRDLPLYLGAGLVWSVVLVAIARAIELEQLPSWLGEQSERGRNLRFLTRGVGLAMFGICYGRLKPFYKAESMAGRASPAPWRAGIGATLAAAVASSVMGALGFWIAR